MKRVAVLSFVVLLVVAGVAGMRTGSAQEGSPPAEIEIAPGVVAFAAVFAPGEEAPVAYKLRIDPGTTYDFAPAPTLDLAYVEAGEATLRLDTATTVQRAGEAGEPVPAGTEVAVEQGDYLVVAPLTTGQVRNDGDEPVVFSMASVQVGHDAAATPAA